jgi:rubrerythrin
MLIIQFRSAAGAEFIHAFAHLVAMDRVKSTQENLKYTINGETYEHVWST